MYYATCRQRVCGQNKDNLCLHAARTLIWRSCAFNRGPMTMPVLDGPMTMPVLDGPMTMPVLDGPMTKPVLDGVKPMAITLPICGTSESLFWKRKKSIYCWTRSRPTWTFGESDDQVRDDRKTSRDRTRVLQPYLLLKSMWTSNFLATNVFQNIFFSVQHKKEINTDSGQHVSE